MYHRQFIILNFIILILKLSLGNEDPIVLTSNGLIRGVILLTGYNTSYYSFKGIPYATPPIGDLRFRAPIEHEHWTDIKNTTKHGNICIQPNPISNMSEDCLFLNIYSRNLYKKSAAVFVLVHGGRYSKHSGDSYLYGPDYLLEENIIVVTLNYRLGILGFLSTEDEHSPGNYGLKDVTLALKWIKKNINSFGGDNENITLVGFSSGAASVNFLMISPLSNNLFQKAIMVSGSSLAPWAIENNPYKYTMIVKEKLKLKSKINKELIDDLRKVKAEDFAQIEIPWRIIEPGIGITALEFTPIKDPINIPESEIFLPNDPIESFNNGNFPKIPYIISHTDFEHFYFLDLTDDDNYAYDIINDENKFLIPNSWKGRYDINDENEIINEIKNHYFNGKNVSIDIVNEWVMYWTDIMFALPAYEFNLIQLKYGNQNGYQYIFKFIGNLNLFKISKNRMNNPGAIHGDDVCYIFKNLKTPSLPDDDPAKILSKEFINMIGNFVKHGTPNPIHEDKCVQNLWLPLQNNTMNTMEIGDQFILNDLNERISFWRDLKLKYLKE